MIITYSHHVDPQPRRPLTQKEIMELEARAPRDEDILFDEDCPPSTPEQLLQFKRVHPRTSDRGTAAK